MRAQVARLVGALAISAGLLMPAAAAGHVASNAARTSSTHAKARHRVRHVKPTSQPVTVTIHVDDPGPPIPAQFLGLSFEVASLPQLASYATRGDLVAMLRSLGPGVLRFGGVTADEQVAWTDAETPRPAWASETIDAEDLRRLGTLAARSDWHVMLTLGMAHLEPQAAAREAAAAQAALGPWLEGVELGNEPNSYANHGFRSAPWTFVQYDEQVAEYRAAIEAAAPGIPLIGPDVSGASAFETWGVGEAIDQKPALLTGHHYPLGCGKALAPSIESLLSPGIRRLGAMSLDTYESIAQAAGIPFRLDETNTVSCGGTAGISNTFASALWASGYMIQTMDAGAVGINLEGNPTNCAGYTPICVQSAAAAQTGELTAQPEWYALLLARHLIGDRPLSETFHAQGHPNMEILPSLSPDGGIHLVILDYEPPGKLPLRVSVLVPRHSHGASVLTLRAPSLTALSGVALGGEAVGADGTWRAPGALPRRGNVGGVITTTVAPASVALLTIDPRRPAG
jgi:hypothetical protein